MDPNLDIGDSISIEDDESFGIGSLSNIQSPYQDIECSGSESENNLDAQQQMLGLVETSHVWEDFGNSPPRPSTSRSGSLEVDDELGLRFRERPKLEMIDLDNKNTNTLAFYNQMENVFELKKDRPIIVEMCKENLGCITFSLRHSDGAYVDIPIKTCGRDDHPLRGLCKS